MPSAENRVLKLLRETFPGWKVIAPPDWLARCRWKPMDCLGKEGDHRVVAVDFIPSANIPRSLYKGEMAPLLNAHAELRVVVCVDEGALADRPTAEDQCRKYSSSADGRVGLKAIVPGLGLQTILPIDLDGDRQRGPIPIEPGWFPEEVLRNALGLQRLSFAATLDSFVARVRHLGNDEPGTLALVEQTIDELLQHYPKCHANLASFMKLAHFEDLFRRNMPGSSEHVFHSFRVFLAGCPIVNRFYDQFRRAHLRYSVGRPASLSIEYSWLLTAIFHDVGRTYEGMQALIKKMLSEQALDDDNIAVTVSSPNDLWLKEEYAAARRLLCSIAAFVRSGPRPREKWDASGMPDDEAKALEPALTSLHDRYSCHAIISAFAMLAEIFDKARAADERTNRRFVLTHAVPAAISIMLHDWRIWPEAKRWGLIPVDMAVLPLAGVLIFLDTWDDYKRKGTTSPICVHRFEIEPTFVEVCVQWASRDEFEKAKGPIKYAALDEALRSTVPMRIRTSVAG